MIINLLLSRNISRNIMFLELYKLITNYGFSLLYIRKTSFYERTESKAAKICRRILLMCVNTSFFTHEYWQNNNKLFVSLHIGPYSFSLLDLFCVVVERISLRRTNIIGKNKDRVAISYI